MIAWITGKIAGPVFGGIAALLAVALIVMWARISDRDKTISDLHTAIDAPDTGWAARLGQCQGNVRTLSAGLDRMAMDMKALGAATAAATAAATRAATAAAAQSRSAQQEAARILALPRPEAQRACLAAGAVLKGKTP
jgi:outer membrane murein-binding lipoprotein Lpp